MLPANHGKKSKDLRKWSPKFKCSVCGAFNRDLNKDEAPDVVNSPIKRNYLEKEDLISVVCRHCRHVEKARPRDSKPRRQSAKAIAVLLFSFAGIAWGSLSNLIGSLGDAQQ
jgi:hypothetical protein